VRDEPLNDGDLDPDPIRQFSVWFGEAKAAGQPEPEAMALATATPLGNPSNRFVLLRGLDQRGFVFYTNGRSRKALEISANPVAALAFRWRVLERQVRVTGPVQSVESIESDAYFATRPRGAQLGAWASAQSEVIGNREELDRQLQVVAARFAGTDVPRPEWWGGFRVSPTEVEFWQGRPDRLHDRLRYQLVAGEWQIRRLSP
jgi:pyridoxamine 5'-phosphate oxidase